MDRQITETELEALEPVYDLDLSGRSHRLSQTPRLAHASGFALGTRIQTPDGLVAIQDLKTGSLVTTRDHGPQPIIWRSDPVVSPQVSLSIELDRDRIGEADLAALTVTPGQRIVIQGEKAELLFGNREVLGNARDLVVHGRMTGLPGVAGPCISLLLERHEIIEADGVWCETLLPDDVRIAEFGADGARDLRRTHPRISHAAGLAAYVAARPALNKREIALLF